jgi:hypothetical protein
MRSASGTVLSEYRGACGTPVWARDAIYAGGRLLASINASVTEPTVSLRHSAVSVSETAATP